MSQLISVVVPAHNEEKRIAETIEAIVGQDYDSLEILLVDDGSTDATANRALEKLQSRRRKFEIIRLKENMGVSAARNEGLRAASGSYVIFMDADDRADPDFVSALYAAITKNDSDIAFCGYRYQFEGAEKGGVVQIDPDPAKSYTGEDFTMMYILKQISPAIWTTIFKKSFLRETGIEFTVGCHFGEDVEFLTKAFSRSDKIAFTKACSYLYVIHSDMATLVSGASKEKLRLRYVDSANGLLRTALYLNQHSRSPKVRDIANNLLLPESLIKSLNAAAQQNDAAKFYQILNASETKRILMSSVKYVTRKPEIFMNAAFLMTAPRIYFRRRSK